jgi:hypothetical protein
MVYTNPVDFETATSDLGDATLIDFEDVKACPSNTVENCDPFDGNTYADQGFTFKSLGGEEAFEDELYIAPDFLNWNPSQSLSVYRFPFDSYNRGYNEDDLIVDLNPPCNAVGFKMIDAVSGTSGEYIEFIDTEGNVVAQNEFPAKYASYLSFLGIVSLDNPIARINIVEVKGDGDDVNYDDFICYPAEEEQLPTLAVMVNSNKVLGHNWPVGQEVTLTIDDPSTTEDPDLTQTAFPYEVEPGHTSLEFDISGQYDVKTGDIVTFTSPEFTKEHVVTRLAILGVDRGQDFVFGQSEPGGDVQVDLYLDGPPLEMIHPDTTDGEWLVNFDTDITALYWYLAFESDQDGDHTFVIWWEPWIENPANGHLYRATEGMSWEDAEARAVELGGHLATVSNAQEEAWLQEQFFTQDFESDFWIGFSDLETEGTWQWSSGETPDYENWCPGEPNNVGEGGEDFANIEGYPYDSPEEYCWNDLSASALHRGIVEKVPYLTVKIDIKPGSDPNCFNNDGNGVIPVAILTTDNFDAAAVDPFSVSLDEASARVKGKSGNAGALEDVDYDGDLDLIIQIEDMDGTYVEGDTIATLSGTTYDGVQITGEDSICIVP